ncbi:hypothetical protein LCGC14_2309500 [marine sediment metagenome]|uniref:PIN domain-containing protein n=1 Tax=marine sediment metagenome TaxID=412755 RepID=A0A0F9FFX9_9ZZZZ
MILLDTCALLWLVYDQKKISSETLHKIDEAPIVYVSSITGFEIGIKSISGKLKLPQPPKQWLKSILEFHDIRVINLDMDICIKSTELPVIHRDPCDRFIIATAIIKSLPVVTTDEHFKEYGIDIMI